MSPAQLSQQQIQKLKDALLSQKQTLIEQLEDSVLQEDEPEDSSALKKIAGSPSSQSPSSELTTKDNHPADLGTELFEFTREETLHRQYQSQLEQTEKAIERLLGVCSEPYGQCKYCSQPIPYERLEALPEADTCLEHSLRYNQPYELQTTESPFSPETSSYVRLKQEHSAMHSDVDIWNIFQSWGNSDSPAMSESPELFEGDDYSEFDESSCYVEPIEEFLATDLYGNQPMIIRNKAYEAFIASQEDDQPPDDELQYME